jgi:arginine decarboxylase
MSGHSMVPKHVFFTKGVGVHKEKLRSFELALRDAGIAQFNLVTVSSILPPGCKIISRQRGLQMLHPGQIIFCVLARNDTNEPNRLISASVGVTMPAGNKHHGYLSEHHAFGQREDVAGEYAEDLAAAMLASTIGMKYDTIPWDRRRAVFKMKKRIVRSTNITQTAIGNKEGEWTSVVAAAVFIL